MVFLPLDQKSSGKGINAIPVSGLPYAIFEAHGLPRISGAGFSESLSEEISEPQTLNKATMTIQPNILHRLAMIARFLISGRARELFYRIGNRIKGLDFGDVPLADLDLSASRARMYSPSGDPQLQRVLKDLGVPKGSRVLDLGCGKGSAIFTLCKFPFVEILGVELSPELVRIAEANAIRLRLQQIHFVCCDAGQFTDYDRFTHLYMYNPFPSVVMQEVMKNLGKSLSRVPRRLVLIYKNPICHDDIMASGRVVAVWKNLRFGPDLNDTVRVYVYAS